MPERINKLIAILSGYREDLPVEVIVKFHGSLQRIGADLGAEIEVLDENYAVITLRAGQIEALYQYSVIEYIELPKLLNVSMNQGLSQSCIPPVQSNPLGLSGRGVIVGVIDSGIDATHPDFRTADGKSRILYIYDQETRTEFNQSQIDAALASPDIYGATVGMDTLGHGTAVTGIAAGNGRGSDGAYRGVAYEADIIAVKLGRKGFESFARTTEIMRAVKYLREKAVMLNKPSVINLSFGTNDGSHSGDSLFETYLDDMAAKWKSSIVVATGNEGSAGHHCAGTIQTGQTVNIPFAVAPYLKSLYLAMWKDFADSLELELFYPNGHSSGPIQEGMATVRPDSGSSVRMFHSAPVPYSRNEEVFFLFFGETGYIPDGMWHIRMTGMNVVSGRFDMWLPSTEQAGRNTAFSLPSPDLTCTLPATAQKVVSVGGYNGALNTYAEFSGRGGKNGKPDLVAPAVSIMSAKTGGGYDRFSGTSMAAPFVSGAAALMMQWGIVDGHDPFLYGERLKAYLQKGATRAANMTYPNPQWGYGALCLDRTMSLLTGP